MPITLYLLAGAFLVGILSGAGGMNWWAETKQARLERAQAAAQAQIDALAAKAQTEAANKITDMTAAYEAGEANAKTVTRTIYVKGQQVVAATPAFANPACVVGADGLQLLNGARAGVQLAANTAAIDGSVPATGAAAGRQDGDVVSGAVTGRGGVPNVQPAAGSVGSGGQVSGASARGVPKNPLQPK